MGSKQRTVKESPYKPKKPIVYFVAHPKPYAGAPKQIPHKKKGALLLDFGPRLFVYTTLGNSI